MTHIADIYPGEQSEIVRKSRPVIRVSVFATNGNGYKGCRFCYGEGAPSGLRLDSQNLHGVSFLLYGEVPQIARRVRSARAVRDPEPGASPVPSAGSTRRSRRGLVLCVAPLVSSFGCGAGPVAS